MAMDLLGETLDIHTGGIDHIPVHHTNEIAQSEAATGKKFANFWLHANFLTVDGTKISKSLDNGFTLDDIREKGFTPLDFRMFVLQSQYRTESNFTWENLSGAAQRLKHWQEVARLRHQTHDTLVDDDDKTTDSLNVALLSAQQSAANALKEDLNTPEALRSIEEAFGAIEKVGPADIHQRALVTLLEWIDGVLGLDLLASTPDISDETKLLIVERDRARDEKDWQRSDELRDEIEKSGVHVRDTAHGTVWY
jgi:cysteinyl-tRNA synthetase